MTAVATGPDAREQPPASTSEIETAQAMLASASAPDAEALPLLNTAQTHFGVVGANGALLNSFPAAPAVTVIKVGLGSYVVIFNRPVAADAYSATLGPFGPGILIPFPGQIAAVPRSGVANGVFVMTYSNTGAPQDRAFSLAVHF